MPADGASTLMSRLEPPRDDRPDAPDAAQGLLRTSDVARMFQVSTRTVSEWARSGRIPCMRTPGGQWRYPADAIRRLVESSERPSWYEFDRLAALRDSSADEAP
jgi:excisionase family DNA binding protein